MSNKIIKAISYAGTSYICYELFQAYRYEKAVKKVEAMRDHKKQMGEIFDESTVDPNVKVYLEDHYGRKIFDRMRSQHAVEGQLKASITEKMQQREEALQKNPYHNVSKLDQEIKQIQEVLDQLKPKMYKPKGKNQEYDEEQEQSSNTSPSI